MVEIHKIKRGRNSRSVTAIGRVTQVNSERENSEPGGQAHTMKI